MRELDQRLSHVRESVMIQSTIDGKGGYHEKGSQVVNATGVGSRVATRIGSAIGVEVGSSVSWRARCTSAS
jgi:hypothetical protein